MDDCDNGDGAAGDVATDEQAATLPPATPGHARSRTDGGDSDYAGLQTPAHGPSGASRAATSAGDDTSRNSMPPPPASAAKEKWITVSKVKRSGGDAAGPGEDRGSSAAAGAEAAGTLTSPGFTQKCTPQRITSAQILLMLKAQPKDSPLHELSSKNNAANEESEAGGSVAVPGGLGVWPSAAAEVHLVQRAGPGPSGAGTQQSGLSGGSSGSGSGSSGGGDSGAAASPSSWGGPGGPCSDREPPRSAKPNDNCGPDLDAGCNCKKSKCLKLCVTQCMPITRALLSGCKVSGTCFSFLGKP